PNRKSPEPAGDHEEFARIAPRQNPSTCRNHNSGLAKCNAKVRRATVPPEAFHLTHHGCRAREKPRPAHHAGFHCAPAKTPNGTKDCRGCPEIRAPAAQRQMKISPEAP